MQKYNIGDTIMIKGYIDGVVVQSRRISTKNNLYEYQVKTSYETKWHTEDELKLVQTAGKKDTIGFRKG